MLKIKRLQKLNPSHVTAQTVTLSSQKGICALLQAPRLNSWK
jgi:hypothetical protein